MRMRWPAAAMAVMLLAGCSSTPGTTSGGPTPAGSPTVSTAPATTAAASPTVKTLTPGNCTLYKKSDAVALLGAVNDNNKALAINTAGGTKIDLCSYLNIIGGSAIEGVSYAVVLYDSPATAFAKATQVRTEMLSDANEHNWAVTPLSTPVPGAGPLLGGTGTKNDLGVTATLAVVGTNVGPYLVVALGASTVGVANAQKFALALFQALAVAVS